MLGMPSKKTHQIQSLKMGGGQDEITLLGAAKKVNHSKEGGS